MKKFLTFVFTGLVCMFGAGAAVRDENTAVRGKTTSVTPTQISRSISNRSAVKKTVSARTAGSVDVLKSRSATTQHTATRTPVTRSGVTARTASSKKKNISVRAATQTGNTAQIETKTGAEYEQCKTAFFTCMDQFCELKNDNYRRCSCSDKVFKYQEVTDNYKNVSEKLTEFTENLDVVALTKEQATAMKTSTEGEDALTEDKSASKQLLKAIMNAIKGEDSSVGGKYKSLNSIVISPDMSNAFGMDDYGQIIAAYNGTNLYKAVFPQCRSAVQADCNDASLQRAVNAYLMAIEQDCNTVETALLAQQKKLKSATYENSAMLDLARVENRQTHNSDDLATCVTNIEKAITSEEVCGEGYHKCLDYGQFIDITTGAPLAGVQNFYELGTLLTFKSNENLQNQKLSQLADNKTFVQFFENKTKKFAKDALDKCTEKSDTAWREYMDRALVDIYYAQQSKVKTIQNSCFDLVAACYDNQNEAISTAMANLTGDYTLNLQPTVISLSTQLCKDYIESCDNMFAGNIIKQYFNSKDKTDSETACRAIAQKCFDDFGGTGYENFYSLYNGSSAPGKAIDWFALYDKTTSSDGVVLSPCAKELQNTEGCNSKEMLALVFGGLDKYKTGAGKIYYTYSKDEVDNITDIPERQLRPIGIATEIYTQIIDRLYTDCAQYNGYFVEAQFTEAYGYNQNNLCQIQPYSSVFADLHPWYHFKTNEIMCPAGYKEKIDVQSWGLCSCWENGNLRSKNGTTSTCGAFLPVIYNSTTTDEAYCTEAMLGNDPSDTSELGLSYGLDKYNASNLWCIQNVFSTDGFLCPSKLTKTVTDGGKSVVYCASKKCKNHNASWQCTEYYQDDTTDPQDVYIIPVIKAQKQHNQ